MTRKYLYDDTTVFIYALKDPMIDKVRYIGWAKNPKKRYSEHLSVARRGFKGHKNNWIRKLTKDNLKPILEIIEEVKYKDYVQREQYWIAYYGRENLVNGTDGGEGTLGWMPSDEQRDRMSKLLKGRPGTRTGMVNSPETRKKISESNKGHAAWNKGIEMPEEQKQKLSDSKKGKPAWNKGIPMTDEQKERLSISKKENMTDEIRENMSEVRRGRKGKNGITSKYVGVDFHKSDKKWRGSISYLGKKYYLGSYNTEEEAAISYDKKSIELFGDKAKTNFPIEYVENYTLPVSKKSSNYFGVSFKKGNNNWSSNITVEGKNIYLGRFSFEVEAALVVNEALLEYFGWKAIDKLNQISQEEINLLWEQE
jgi:predicted GIY-YIG superfamily endonuclease